MMGDVIEQDKTVRINNGELVAIAKNLSGVAASVNDVIRALRLVDDRALHRRLTNDLDSVLENLKQVSDTLNSAYSRAKSGAKIG